MTDSTKGPSDFVVNNQHSAASAASNVPAQMYKRFISGCQQLANRIVSARMLEWLSQKAKRILRIVGGFLLILLGAILGPVPGVWGFPVAFAGLVLLSYEFEWARNLRHKIHDKAHNAREWFKHRRR